MLNRPSAAVVDADANNVPARLPLILGSASPRRLELLARIGITPDRVIAADIDETPHRGEPPRDYVRRMANDKAMSLRGQVGGLVLAADTVVTAGRRILGKPRDRDEAAAFLNLLSGRRHRVLTAVTLSAPDRTAERLVETQVRFRPLSPSERTAYLDTGEWEGKAGGYAIQGRAEAFIPWICGSYSSVVGLPLSETATLLARFGHVGDNP